MPARTNCPFPSEHLIASLPAREASNPSEGLWSDIEQKKCDGCFASAGCASNISLPRCSPTRSEEHTSELQSLMRNSYAVFCLKKKNTKSAQPHNCTYRL